MDLNQLDWLVRDKLIKVSNGNCNHAFQLFTTTSNGIKLYEFQRTLTRLGFQHEDTLNLKALFDRYDQDKNAEIDLKELSQALFPEQSEFPKSYMTLYRQQEVAKTTQAQWNVHEIERKIRSKIEQHTSRSSDCFRQAHRIFKKAKGITPIDFQNGLAMMGLELNQQQTKLMFDRYDTDHSGDIDLQEFVIGVLGHDYQTTSQLQMEIHHRMNQRMGKTTASFQQAWQEFQTRQEVFDQTLRMLGYTNLTLAQRRDLYLQSRTPSLTIQPPSTPRPSTSVSIVTTRPQMPRPRKPLANRRRIITTPKRPFK